MDNLNRILIKELEVLELGSKIQSQVQSEVGKNQREYFLREQMKAIQKELGEGDDQTKEIEELAEKIEAAGMPEAVKKEALRELDRLSKMPVAAAEYTVSRTYLDWLVALPWNKRTDEVIDLPQDQEVLDADHSGLEKAKDRILEYLAVRKLNPGRQGADPLLRRPSRRRQDVARARRLRSRSAASSSACRSAACATKPKSAATAAPTSARCRARSSRACGARSRTTRCSSSTRSTSWAPISAAIPSSALLEVLDPEQNNTFRDHYLDVPFDLSEVLFITTANVLDPIPPPLRDRMEVLEIAGYTEEEKLNIATDHLVDKQVKNHGLTPEYIRLHARRAASGDSRLHARGRRPEPRAGNRRALPQGRASPRRRRRDADRDHAGGRRRDARRAEVPRRGDGGAHQGSGRGDRPRVDAGRRRGAVHRSVADGGHRLPDPDRSARRRDEGVGARGAVLAADARQANTASIRTSSRTPRCTCTCRQARFRKTARRRA